MPANETTLPVSPTSPATLSSEETVTVRDGTALHTYRWTSRAAEARSGAVVLLAHGYGEYGRRYDAFARYLVSRGFPTYCYDQRGHGFSPGRRGHVESYTQYVDDCSDIARDVAQRHPQRPLVLLGHSNGGLTVLRTVQRGEIPFAGLVMTCPMVALQPRHKPLPRGIASVFSALLPRVSLPNGVDIDQLSHDAEINSVWKADPMNHGRTTPRWYVGALDAMAQAQAEASKVTLPVLSVAAELDSVVDPQGVAQFTERLPSSDRELVVCKGAFHEVLNELDREQTYKRIGDWLSARFSSVSKAQTTLV